MQLTVYKRVGLGSWEIRVLLVPWFSFFFFFNERENTSLTFLLSLCAGRQACMHTKYEHMCEGSSCLRT